MKIHEDDSIPAGQARVSLDFSEIWCHPDDAEAIRQQNRTGDEVREAVARALAAEAPNAGDDPHFCMYCEARRARGWACSACPVRATDPVVARMPDEWFARRREDRNGPPELR